MFYTIHHIRCAGHGKKGWRTERLNGSKAGRARDTYYIYIYIYWMEILMACATTRSKYDTPTKEPDLFFVNTFLDS